MFLSGFYLFIPHHMTLRTTIMIGLITLASAPLTSSAMTLVDGTVADQNTTVISTTESTRTNQPIVTKDVDNVAMTQ
jgi:hypothetical protein